MALGGDCDNSIKNRRDQKGAVMSSKLEKQRCSGVSLPPLTTRRGEPAHQVARIFGRLTSSPPSPPLLLLASSDCSQSRKLLSTKLGAESLALFLSLPTTNYVGLSNENLEQAVALMNALRCTTHPQLA